MTALRVLTAAVTAGAAGVLAGWWLRAGMTHNPTVPPREIWEPDRRHGAVTTPRRTR